MNCVDGIEVDRARLRAVVATSVGVVTALTPYIGYETAAELAHVALATGESIRELVLARGLVDEATLDRVLTPERLSGLLPPTGAIATIR